MRMTYVVGIVICAVVLMGTAPDIFAEAFVPQPLEIEVELDYDHQTIHLAGTHPVTIRVGVYGHDAMVVAAFRDHYRSSIVEEPIQYMNGWRYVNKVDTLNVVFAPKYAQNGTEVEFTHYFTLEEVDSVQNIYTVWAYSMDTPQQVFAHAPVDGGTIIEYDYGGDPHDPPFYVTGPQYDDLNGDTVISRERWVIGRDAGAMEPDDRTWYTGEHTALNGNFADMVSWREGPMFMAGTNPDEFFVSGYGTAISDDIAQDYAVIRNFRWVSAGEAELITDWGETGSIRLATMMPGSEVPEAANIRNDMFLCPVIDQFDGHAGLTYVDALEGYKIYNTDISTWWNPGNGFTDNAWYAPERLRVRTVAGEHLVALSNHLSRLAMIINPHDNDGDILRVVSAVPDDYVDPLLVERPSIGDNSPVLTMNGNGWMFYPISGPDTAFGLLANSGDKIGHFPLAAGSPPSEFHLVESGTIYDGMYMDRSDEPGLWFVPFVSEQAEISIFVDIFGATDVDEAAPGMFSLGRNRPNPFNPITTIPFSLPHEAAVTIDILTTAGTVAATLTDRTWAAGTHEVTWDATGLASGTYFCRMRAGEFSTIHKIMMLK